MSIKNNSRLKNKINFKNCSNMIFSKKVKGILQDDIATQLAFFFLSFVVVLILIAIFILDENYLVGRLLLHNRNQPPTFQHPLGTNERGRDALTVLIFATKNSVLIILFTTFISSVFGVLVGFYTGYKGGKIDDWFMGIINIFSIIPAIILVLMFAQVYNIFTIVNFSLTLAMFRWMDVARLSRLTILQEKEREYVQASKTLGSSTFKIIFKRIFPNIFPTIISGVIINATGILAIETTLSYLKSDEGVRAILNLRFVENGFFDHATPTLGGLINPERFLIHFRGEAWAWLPATLMIILLLFSLNQLSSSISKLKEER